MTLETDLETNFQLFHIANGINCWREMVWWSKYIKNRLKGTQVKLVKIIECIKELDVAHVWTPVLKPLVFAYWIFGYPDLVRHDSKQCFIVYLRLNGTIIYLMTIMLYRRNSLRDCLPRWWIKPLTSIQIYVCVCACMRRSLLLSHIIIANFMLLQSLLWPALSIFSTEWPVP